MRMRTLWLGMLTAGLAQAVAMTASAEFVDWVDFKVDDDGVGTIEVQGPNTAAYKEVLTKTLDYVIQAKGNPTETAGDSTWTVKLSTNRPSAGQPVWKKFEDTLYEEWNKYKVIQEYYDSHLHLDVSKPLAPVRRCNDLLKRTSGAARAAFLFNGATFGLDDAYTIFTEAVDPKGHRTEAGSIWVPVRIKCLPLSRDPQRAALRIEPAKVQAMGKFLCPTELKLHGYVETHPKFDGKSIFVGPHYLSAFTTLQLQAEGSRNVTATYKMDWQKMGGLATAPNAEPRKQKLVFRFNIADKANKLLQSSEKTVEVSCRKIKANAPTASDSMTIDPSN